MTTQQTQTGLGRSVGESREGLLRLALKIYAVASGALGALALAAGVVLDDLLGIPLALLVPVGLFLIVYAAFVWVVGTRPGINRTAAWAIIAVNLLWVLDSVVLVMTGWLSLTAMGIAFVLAQAVAVALFAGAQFYALRRAS